jgi:hypothetical protein
MWIVWFSVILNLWNTSNLIFISKYWIYKKLHTITVATNEMNILCHLYLLCTTCFRKDSWSQMDFILFMIFFCVMPLNSSGIFWNWNLEDFHLYICVIYIRVKLKEIGQWLRLALSNGPNWVGLSCPIHLRMETDPVSETLWDFLSSTYKMMDKVQNKPSSSVQHTPSSESFQVNL